MIGVLFTSLVLLLLGLAAYLWNIWSPEQRDAFKKALRMTLEFYRTIVFFIWDGKYSECPYFEGHSSKKAIVARIFSLCLVFKLWSKPHYRNGTFQDDMKKNLRNVAVPGSGIPLSVFAYAKILSYFFLFALYPLFALVAAINVGRRDISRVCSEYELQLLEPTDWFSFWRLNCALASYHASVTNDPETGYALEDKLTFLQVAQEKDIAVSPFLEIPAIICKHRNEEGGLGYMFYSNATNGGDWIIQEVLSNDEAIAPLLPEKAPLSTFRVITISTQGDNTITPLSCVWRAGRSGAQTDHSAVLFDVDSEKGEYKKGITNTHWYQLGVKPIFTTEWTAVHSITEHPDTGKQITGEKVDAKSIMGFAKKAHETMMPKVPIVGWDVALTNKGMLLLECNLSCNFFLGSFDVDQYFNFVDKYFTSLESGEG